MLPLTLKPASPAPALLRRLTSSTIAPVPATLERAFTAVSRPVLPLFAGQVKLADNERASDSYVRYTPLNTACPLSTWHSLAKPQALREHFKDAEVLEGYIRGKGEYYQIPWIQYAKAVGEEPYTVFDTETTGLKSYDRIVQLAASEVTKDHEVRHLADMNTYINPGTDKQGNPFPIQPGAQAVHGISSEMLADKPTIDKLLPNIRKGLLHHNRLGAAYNAKFDINYINNAIEKWNKSPNRKASGYLRPIEPALTLDAFILIQRIHPFVSLRKRLSDQYMVLMGHELENKHDAQADTDGTVDVLKYCFKYLQKHAIPQEWAQFAADNLPQRNYQPGEKTAAIAQFVRDHRAVLAKVMPNGAQTLKITDVLRFQHGTTPLYDGTELPKLDINLSLFGWDGTKYWEDKNDVLDAEVVKEIRTERDADNRSFISGKFRHELNSTHLMEAATVLQNLTKPVTKPDDAEEKANALSTRVAYSKELILPVAETFMTRFLDKMLPTDQVGWDALQAEITESMMATAQSKLKRVKDVPELAQGKLREYIGIVAKDCIPHMQNVQAALGDRYFYLQVPIDPKKPLIHPDVLKLNLHQGRRLTPDWEKNQPGLHRPEVKPAADEKQFAVNTTSQVGQPTPWLHRDIKSAIPIKPYWFNEIMEGRKTWEIRGQVTHTRGMIGLIESGTGHIGGQVDLVDCIGPLTKADLLANVDKHGMPAEELEHGKYPNGTGYKNAYAYVFKDPQRLEPVIPYNHPSGAITRVTLNEKSLPNREKYTAPQTPESQT
jgi:DNA polymerase III epsilon subunit-like protein